MSNRFQQLMQVGQSLWYDNIQRSLIKNGTLKRMIEEGEIRGITSNPTIFNLAISKSQDYDSAIAPMAWAGWSAEQIFYQLAVEDIQSAADLFLPLYEKSDRADGYVSLEVSPYLARDAQATVREALELWKRVDRPNLMIKIPATREGLEAIREAIAQGINVNVTLIFSLERYREVIEAYLSGLEKRVNAGLPVDRIASVASFFVSRVDTKVDALLEKLIAEGNLTEEEACSLMGKTAIANAKLAYQIFKETFNSSRFKRLAEKGARVQRPLWASTSTKNPRYRDVLYVEELIGPLTVNTVPPQTLDAFRDHGNVSLTLEEGVEEAKSHLAHLEHLGISMSLVTAQLEEEGVKAFADSFSTLLQTLTQRKEEFNSSLGPLARAVSQRVKVFEETQFIERFHRHDPFLWSSIPEEQEEIRKRMGWLEAPQTSRALVSAIEQFAQEVVEAGFTHAVLLGMGGSSLAPEVLRQVFGVGKIGEHPALDLLILDSTDPAQVLAVESWSPVERTLYIVSSKSGTTIEITAFMEYFWKKAVDRFGSKAGSHFIAITDPGTKLEKIAKERNFRKVFLADPTVGGRNSALTAFGLVPAGLLGINLEEFLSRAEQISRECRPQIPAGRNPGLVLGAILGESALAGRDKVTLLTDALWQPLGAWLEQLIAESSGKRGKGIVPVDLEPLYPADVYGADRLFVYLRSTGEKDDFVNQLVQGDHPVVVITTNDPMDLAGEFYRWEVATAVACSVIGVNSFDQPDVQDNKDRSVKKIQNFHETGVLEQEKPVWEKHGVQVFSTSPIDGLSLKEVVMRFLQNATQGDYIAINAYLPRTPEMQTVLGKLRTWIQQLTGLPTTLGFGPRFLHSTGQLHKGGANNGLFLQITADSQTDVEIPGMNLTFGQLERAQALGDYESLVARGRRVIRIHLGKTPHEILDF
ncbi:bifunctional transaldolase/phosoglucose isomerase [Anaerolinea thermophila]|uniref:Transaldolase n=1 Tax=Anaerolinea thermophila (strain DSM 14523 / JCM 11388 / NBRC 100420 / UNI-1) TaxID=926569 RepID=E8N5W8_ANATU|nr:bifunctional transaldolase/phosoglucose isomerase [Anaerolinea thermophila]BAJ63832.1 transaldolase/glucose-6-phosphate isomerase [Anaerolinea thermophila UNI-1]